MKDKYQLRYWLNGGGFIYSPRFHDLHNALKYAAKLPRQYDIVLEKNGVDVNHKKAT